RRRRSSASWKNSAGGIGVFHQIREVFFRPSLGPGDIISQALRSGEVISRLPYSEKNINYRLSKGEVYSKYLLQSPSGVARIRSVVDGIDRIQGYQALERYPVVVQVGFSRQDV
ncbi:hypothetical protein ACI2KR_29695, partial [Pseudomonas luteola]